MFAKTAQVQRPLRWAGTLLFFAGAVILMGIITAEALYPGVYSTYGNEISDLGGTRPPNSVVLQPSAAIFDGTMLLSGALILISTVLIHRALRRRMVTITLGLFGGAVFLIGVFPGNTSPHAMIAPIVFLAAGVVAIAARKILTPPLRQISVMLGSISLLSTVLAFFFIDWAPVAELGDGGIERWIAYPAVLWLTTFGGYLMGYRTTTAAASVGAASDREPASVHS